MPRVAGGTANAAIPPGVRLPALVVILSLIPPCSERTTHRAAHRSRAVEAVCW